MSELYELPEGWEWKKLIEVVDLSNKTVNITDNKEYHCIGLEHIESNTEKLVDFMPSNGLSIKSNKVVFEKDMVLYGKLRPYLNKVWIAEFDGIATTEILPLKPFENLLNSHYLAHYLRSSFFVNKAMENISGARMPRITTKYLRSSAYVPIPPLPEQKRIVAKLDLLFEKIDRAIALHRKNMDEANGFMGSVLNDVFGELEGKYEKRKINEISTVKGGKRVPKGYKLTEEVTPYPYLRVTDFKYSGLVCTDKMLYLKKEVYEKIKRYTITDEDLYMGISKNPISRSLKYP